MKERNSLRYGSESDSFVCHEWEEFVGKLCDSEDPHLKEIGYQELAILKVKGGEAFLKIGLKINPVFSERSLSLQH